MAREAEEYAEQNAVFINKTYLYDGVGPEYHDLLYKKFAALVEAAARADEREACAKLCDEIGEESDTFTRYILRCTADAIRAKGGTP
jgi:hypothetical protein